MKNNLKTFPIAYEIPRKFWNLYLEKAFRWRIDFEAELRAELERHQEAYIRIKEPTSKVVNKVLEQTYKNILGEE